MIDHPSEPFAPVMCRDEHHEQEIREMAWQRGMKGGLSVHLLACSAGVAYEDMLRFLRGDASLTWHSRERLRAKVGGAMKPAELDEIEKRAKAATEGPWSRWEGALSWVEAAGGAKITGHGLTSENALFIARAREDVPALVAEVRRLREDLGKALAYAEHDYGCMTEVGQPCSCGWAADRAAIHEALGRTNG